MTDRRRLREGDGAIAPTAKIPWGQRTHRLSALNYSTLVKSHNYKQAQLSLTDRAMLVCKVVEVWQDFLSECRQEVHVHMLQKVN